MLENRLDKLQGPVRSVSTLPRSIFRKHPGVWSQTLFIGLYDAAAAGFLPVANVTELLSFC